MTTDPIDTYLTPPHSLSLSPSLSDLLHLSSSLSLSVLSSHTRDFPSLTLSMYGPFSLSLYRPPLWERVRERVRGRGRERERERERQGERERERERERQLSSLDAKVSLADSIRRMNTFFFVSLGVLYIVTAIGDVGPIRASAVFGLSRSLSLSLSLCRRLFSLSPCTLYTCDSQ